jgi:hypothetical protein
LINEAKTTRFISPAAKVRSFLLFSLADVLFHFHSQKEIAVIFHKFVTFNGKVLTYQQLRYVEKDIHVLRCSLFRSPYIFPRLAEERNDDKFPASMKMRNELLSGTLRTVHLSLSKLNSYISIALAQSPVNEDAITAKLIASLNSVKNATRSA